ncbi:MAG: MlaD family protein [Halioglobus sp.]|nr:MlaD family protein [Halioglobus sp.]
MSSSSPSPSKGLVPGAAVEFRGIPVGRVERLLLRESVGNAMESGAYGQGIAIPVLVYLEPARMELPDRAASLDILRESIATGIDDGLRASLESGNLLTGSKYVNLDYFSDVQPAEPTRFLDYPTIPTVDTGLGQLQQQVSSILTTIDNLPLDQTVAEANAAIGELNSALEKFNTLLAQPGTRELPGNLDATLEEVRSTLQGLSPGSGLYESLNSSLLRLNRTLGNLESVTDTLASKPNAVLLPSKPTPDPVPEARK